MDYDDPHAQLEAEGDSWPLRIATVATRLVLLPLWLFAIAAWVLAVLGGLAVQAVWHCGDIFAAGRLRPASAPSIRTRAMRSRMNLWRHPARKVG